MAPLDGESCSRLSACRGKQEAEPQALRGDGDEALALACCRNQLCIVSLILLSTLPELL